MNLANKITLFRVICIPVFIIFMYMEGTAMAWAALTVYALGSISDFVDGYIARKYNMITDFGKFMDPLADKMLVITAMLMFVAQGRMPAWILALVITREFAVSGLRLIAVEGGRVIAAGKSGKIKTAATMICNIIMLIPFFTNATIDMVCSMVILVTTLYSGIEYFIVNRDVMNFKDKKIFQKTPAEFFEDVPADAMDMQPSAAHSLRSHV